MGIISLYEVPVHDERARDRLENDLRKEFSPSSPHAVPINREYWYLQFARPHKSICVRVQTAVVGKIHHHDSRAFA